MRVFETRPHRGGMVLATLGLLGLLLAAEPASARGLMGVVDDLVRGAARVADEIPTQKVDDLVAELSKSRKAREAVDAELRRAGHLDEAGKLRRGLTRADAVFDVLRKSGGGLDPSVLRRLEGMDAASRETALVLAKGGEHLTKAVPDLAVRSRLVREGGVETLAAVGSFGPDAAREAVRFSEALRGGKVVVRPGQRVVTLADFGNALNRSGERAWTFWKLYVQPNGKWKYWLVSGALAAYLVNPDFFHDAAGKLTEAGFRRLTELMGYETAAIVRGVGTGLGEATQQVHRAMWETFFNPTTGRYALVGLLVLLGGAALLFRRVRFWVLTPFRWLNQSPPPPTSSHS